MQAATTPNKTSQVRQYQFGMLSPLFKVSVQMNLSHLPAEESYKLGHWSRSGNLELSALATMSQCYCSECQCLALRAT